MDTHELGLPLKFVAANMLDSLDDRQASLQFHAKQKAEVHHVQAMGAGKHGLSAFSGDARSESFVAIR
jgi:hypothetical protein